MDNWLNADKKLLLKHEALRSRLDIRDFFLKNMVKEIFENIGQVLSVVRMQLAVLDPTNSNAADNGSTPGNLVGQSIRDLRAMCRSLYPDADILKDEGLTEGLTSIIEILFNIRPVIKVKGVRKEIQPELKLIVFKMLQEILISINETDSELISVSIAYSKDEVDWMVSFKGQAKLLYDETTGMLEEDLTLQQRAKLIKGRFVFTESKTGVNRIKLITPLNIQFL